MAGEYQLVSSFKQNCTRITPQTSAGIWANFALGPAHSDPNRMKYVDTGERRTVSAGGLYTDAISWCCGVAIEWSDKVALTHIIPTSAVSAASDIDTQATFLSNARSTMPDRVFLAQMPVHSLITNDQDALKSSLYVAMAALQRVYGQNVRTRTTLITGYKTVDWDTSCTLTVTVGSGISIVMPGLRPG